MKLACFRVLCNTLIRVGSNLWLFGAYFFFIFWFLSFCAIGNRLVFIIGGWGLVGAGIDLLNFFGFLCLWFRLNWTLWLFGFFTFVTHSFIFRLTLLLSLLILLWSNIVLWYDYFDYAWRFAEADGILFLFLRRFVNTDWFLSFLLIDFIRFGLTGALDALFGNEETFLIQRFYLVQASLFIFEEEFLVFCFLMISELGIFGCNQSVKLMIGKCLIVFLKQFVLLLRIEVVTWSDSLWINLQNLFIWCFFIHRLLRNYKIK